MSEPTRSSLEHRVLVLVPSGRDLKLTASILQRAALEVTGCSKLQSVCEEIARGAGAALIAEECLGPDQSTCLEEWLKRQPAWSDFPILILARPGADSTGVAQSMDLLGNVTVLERPMRIAALVSAVRAALRSRQKQYQLRDDLIERERHVQALAFQAAIVSSSDDAIVSKTLDGLILTWNEGAERIFGYTAREAIGQPITMLIPPERQAEEPRLLNRLRNGKRIQHFETVRITKDGRRIDISLTLSPVRDSHGIVVGASKVARDITQQKRAEAAVKVLSLLPAQNPSPVLRIARNGTLLYANPSAMRALSEWNLQVGETVPAIMRELMIASSNGSHTFIREYSHAERVFLITIAYVPDEDYANLYWTDITELKRAESALKEADRRKDEFLAVLAHELRNPLAPIRNSLHILRLTGQNDLNIIRVSEMIDRQVNHLVRLVDDLMEVSRITRGKIELQREQIEVAAIVRSAVEASQPLIEAAGHQLALTLPPEPLLVDGDPVRLTQVVSNLLNNAAKYTDPGGQIWLTVRPDGPSVNIAVRDNGIGIPEDMLARVFGLFAQIDRTANRGQGGLGIGLALVKSLVEMHGGTVVAQSDGPGMGCEFIIRLPVVSRTPLSEPVKSGFQSLPLLPQRTVLVVDDNRDAAESLGMLLRLLGADVHLAFSGPDALEAIGRCKPAVVLLDIGMPGMSGHEVARRIRQLPDFRDVMLIALTGWGQEDDLQLSKAAGFNHHLVKPADVDALGSLLMSVQHGPPA